MSTLSTHSFTNKYLSSISYKSGSLLSTVSKMNGSEAVIRKHGCDMTMKYFKHVKGLVVGWWLVESTDEFIADWVIRKGSLGRVSSILEVWL